MLQILSGEKKTLERNGEKVKPPCWPELGIKNVWAEVQSDRELLKYFPDYKQGALPPRDFFWNVFARVSPQHYEKLISHAIKLRGLDVTTDESNRHELKIQKEWLDRLIEAKVVKRKSAR